MQLVLAEPATGAIANRLFESSCFWLGRGGFAFRLTRLTKANSISQRITGFSGVAGVAIEQVKTANAPPARSERR